MAKIWNLKSPIIILTGPESTGKTTLTHWLGDRFGLEVVLEYAREYLENIPGFLYSKHDVLSIAHKQAELELLASVSGLPFVCDTDLVSIYIWMDYRYGTVDEYVQDKIESYGRDRHYLLCSADIPWEPDPLRENPHDRDVLFQKHIDLLTEHNLHYTILSGDYEQRLEFAEQAVRKILYGTPELH